MDGPLLILIPIFNDWQASALLLPQLDRTLDRHGLRAEVLLVDDASPTAPPVSFSRQQYSALDRVDVLGLRRNLGHQRAIAIGFAYPERHRLRVGAARPRRRVPGAADHGRDGRGQPRTPPPPAGPPGDGRQSPRHLCRTDATRRGVVFSRLLPPVPGPAPGPDGHSGAGW